jgi:amino acid adenylation domain-containing protein
MNDLEMKKSMSIIRDNQNVLPDPTLLLDNRWYGSIQDKFYTNVSKHTAILTESDYWTYEELDYASNRVANHILLNRKDGDSNFVGIYAGRNAALVIALLGIIKAGVAFVILDPRYPLNRIINSLNVAKPMGIVNATSYETLPVEIISVLSENKCKFITNIPCYKKDFVNTDNSELFNNKRVIKQISQDDTLYMAFTSGTSGTPKAIIGSQSPVTHFFHWQAKTFGLNREHRISVLSGLAHDPLLRDILMPLWIGATICIPDEKYITEPKKLLAWMHNNKITLTHLTPSLGYVLLAGNTRHNRIVLEDLKFAFFGGDRLTYKFTEKFRELAPNATIVNCYGTTETPQVMGYYIVDDRHIANFKDKPLTIPIGRGISDCQIIVLDENMQLCKIEQEGEIFVRSAYRAKDIYEESTSLFSSPLLPNPFTHDVNDIMYRTGDYGYYMHEGSVVYLGRKDKQVKVRGFRIEIAEIEKILASDINVFQFILDIESTIDGDKYLCLYYVPSHDIAKETKYIRQLLVEHLPKYMIPDKIIMLEEMPLTPNGKIDLNKLKAVSKEKDESQDNEALTDQIETKLITILKKILYSQVINISDRINEIGISSLQIIEVCCEIEKTFNVDILVSDLAKCELISDISQLIYNKKMSVEDITHGLNDSYCRDSIINQNSDSFTILSGFPPSKPARFIPDNENILVGIKNRVFQLIARIAPDVWRIRLHKLRGVDIGENVSIGYDTIIETAYPWLVHIGNNVNIGMRATIIGHFRGMVEESKGTHTVEIGDYAFIGPGVIILPNVVIGEGSVVAAGSIVTSNIPPFTLVKGNPARPVAKCGIPLSGPTTYREFIANLKKL